MDFSLSAEQQALIDTTRKFAAAELPDLARTIEQNNSPPPRSLLKRYAELGLMGINLPAEYGGAGMGHLEAALAQHWPSPILPQKKCAEEFCRKFVAGILC